MERYRQSSMNATIDPDRYSPAHGTTLRARLALRTAAGRHVGDDVRRVVRDAWRTRRGCDCCTPCRPHPADPMRVGDLADRLGISQSTCSHHVRRLAEVGFVAVDKVGTASVVSVNPACCYRAAARGGRRDGHPVDAALLPRRPAGRRDHPGDDRRRPADGPGHLRRGDRHPQRDVRDRGPVTRGPERQVAAGPPVGGRDRRRSWTRGRRLDRHLGRVRARVLRRSRRDERLRHRGALAGRGVGQSTALPAGHRGGRRRPVDAADLDLPGEPRLHRPAPRRGLPHARGAPADRAARRDLAGHGAARATTRRRRASRLS